MYVFFLLVFVIAPRSDDRINCANVDWIESEFWITYHYALGSFSYIYILTVLKSMSSIRQTIAYILMTNKNHVYFARKFAKFIRTYKWYDFFFYFIHCEKFNYDCQWSKWTKITIYSLEKIKVQLRINDLKARRRRKKENKWRRQCEVLSILHIDVYLAFNISKFKVD